MVGLTILLDSHKKSFNKSPQIINKTTIIKPSPPPPPPPPPSPYSSSSSSCWYSSSPLPSISFLDKCFLCKQRLLPGKDIYMYNGDRAFCSVDCRCRQIFMDEESIKRENCSVAAMKVKSTSSASSSSRHQRKGNKNRAGDFAY